MIRRLIKLLFSETTTDTDKKAAVDFAKTESLLLKKLSAKLSDFNKKSTLHAGEAPFRA